MAIANTSLSQQFSYAAAFVKALPRISELSPIILRHFPAGFRYTEKCCSCEPPGGEMRGRHGSSRLAALGDKFKRDAVVAPSFSRRRRAVVENMTVVAAATDTVVFGTGQ